MKNKEKTLELIKALAPGGLSMSAGSGSTVISDFAQIMAAALRGMPRIIYLFLMHTHFYTKEDYSDPANVKELNELFRLMQQHFLTVSRYPAASCYPVAAAILETFSGPTVCTRCGGSGVIKNSRGENRECWRCRPGKNEKPTGLQRYISRELAEFARVPKSTWIDNHERYYNDAAATANTWLAIAASMIEKQLSSRGESKCA